jgi:hypothetical protein
VPGIGPYSREPGAEAIGVHIAEKSRAAGDAAISAQRHSGADVCIDASRSDHSPAAGPTAAAWRRRGQ